jgi:hypothetical protein
LEIGTASWPSRVFKLAKSAERHWRRLDGADRLGQLIEGIEFRDGEAVQAAEEKAAASHPYTRIDHCPFLSVE